ncbi:outer membrane porin, OprD family [Aquirufa nivalisilvae]|uniref:OprD family outer membrane porin n=1 Tax=Aquirufa nivalisilvae TaxID=2516557 RepID=UPI0022A8D800|nr:OprD family outer membrane porin [Aquirufa nivalisilvae]MCZ2482036.1 outer membrane porin, OprD family [Aquirufa nivalisilvae]
MPAKTIRYLIQFCSVFLLSTVQANAWSSHATDSLSVWNAVTNGKIRPNLRYFYMNTDNAGESYDAYAHGINLGITYETIPWKHIRLGISGQWMYNIHSTSFTPDPKFPILNRYELGLFDLIHPQSKEILSRLEKLYIAYSIQKSSIKMGRQVINTPFINPQDGRLRPTAVAGIWVDWNNIPNTKLEGGFLSAISPRSTTQWFGIGESLGIYPQGQNPDGTKSNYLGNINSRGIGILGITLKQMKPWSIQAWNMYVDQVMYTGMLQADTHWSTQQPIQWTAGFQYIEQHAVQHGGNPDPSKAYMSPGAMSRTFGAKLGWESKQWKSSVNYNRITGEGRYLMPREWGKDPFFTFMPRERNEGMGDVQAYVAKISYQWNKVPLKAQIAHGYFLLPDVTNFTLNKYAMPSYSQSNIDVSFEPKGKWQNLKFSMLYVYKKLLDNESKADKFIINKVNMSQVNFIVNYEL